MRRVGTICRLWLNPLFKWGTWFRLDNYIQLLHWNPSHNGTHLKNGAFCTLVFLLRIIKAAVWKHSTVWIAQILCSCFLNDFCKICLGSLSPSACEVDVNENKLQKAKDSYCNTVIICGFAGCNTLFLCLICKTELFEWLANHWFFKKSSLHVNWAYFYYEMKAAVNLSLLELTCCLAEYLVARMFLLIFWSEEGIQEVLPWLPWNWQTGWWRHGRVYPFYFKKCFKIIVLRTQHIVYL